MKVIPNYRQFPATSSKIALTIGNFDGVHLGHQTLLKSLKEAAPFSVVYTFENHPASVLRNIPLTYLTTLEHRLSLFEKMGITLTILAPFTKEFAQQSAREFLTELRKYVPFSSLILGYDSLVGADRVFDLSFLAKEMGFEVKYMKPVSLDGMVISSREIRKLIQEGKLQEASAFLGRPYSIFAHVEPGAGKGRELGFHTANLAVENLVLPPLGVYAVKVKIQDQVYSAVANLGHAPTLHTERPTCLEVHLIGENRDLYNQEIEVIFFSYLRPEKCFANIDLLKEQIKHDIQTAKQTLLHL